MDSLCGKSKYQFAEKVFEFNSNKKIFPEIFAWMTKKLGELQGQIMQEQEVVTYSHAIVILCKMIKQNPKLYNELNEEYKRTSTMNSSNFMFDCQKSHNKLSVSRASIGVSNL